AVPRVRGGLAHPRVYLRQPEQLHAAHRPEPADRRELLRHRLLLPGDGAAPVLQRLRAGVRLAVALHHRLPAGLARTLEGLVAQGGAQASATCGNATGSDRRDGRYGPRAGLLRTITAAPFSDVR